MSQGFRSYELDHTTGSLVSRAASAPARTGYSTLLTQELGLAALLMATMSFAGLCLTYGMNTWLPRIMESYGYGELRLWFPFVLNGAAVIGGMIAATASDRLGKPQNVIATTGRTGGVVGPMAIGRLVAAGLGASEQFYVFAGVVLLGGLVTVLVPRKHKTYLIERRLLIDHDADQQETQAAREAVADSPVAHDGAAASNQGPRTGA